MQASRRIKIAITSWTLLATTSILSTVSVGEDDWAHWRGPTRNAHVAEESGWESNAWQLNKEPNWKVEVGEGSSSPLVVSERLYTMGWRDGQDYVFCLDATTARMVWRQSYACPRYGRLSNGDKGIYSGPSSTPEFDAQTGLLYTLSADGHLNCWDTRSNGRRVWGRNLYDDFDVPQRPKVGRSGLRDYGYTSSPLVHTEWLIVEVGASEGNLIAFDKRTGDQRWVSQSKSPPGHNGGPVPMTVAGVDCLAVHNFTGLLVVRLDDGHEGHTVATYEWITEFANNITTATVHENTVLLTSSYNQHKIAKFEVTLDGVRKLWEQTEASKVCSPIVYEGHVYWAWRNVMCLDFATGQVRWRGGRITDPGSCIVTSDGRLIVWANRGDLLLVETAKRSPDKYIELAALKNLGRDDAWPHLVLASRRLYCRDRTGQLLCFELGS